MKKKLSVILIITTMITGTAGCNFISAADSEADTIAMEVTGSTAMVEARTVLDSLGYDTNWESTSKTLYASKNKNVIALTLNSDIALLNGEKVKMNGAAALNNGVMSITSAAMSALTDEKINDDGTVITEEEASDDSWKNNEINVNLADIKDGSYKITEAGIYNITGSYSGMIHINTEGKVKLVLNNVEINNSNGPAIFCENSEKVIIELTENSVNTLTDGSSYSVDAKGCIFSNDDIDIQGQGSLNINGNYNHGIVSDDDIDIKEAAITVTTSVGDGIKANDGIKIKSGTINITAMGDGISGDKCVVISEAKINITTKGDIPVSSNNDFPMGGGRNFAEYENTENDRGQMAEGESFRGRRGQMNDGERPEMPNDGEFRGEIQEMPNGGEFNGERPEMPNGGEFNGERPQMPNGSEFNRERQEPQSMDKPQTVERNSEITTSDESNVSSKGIKSDRNITISSGEITINSTDHGIKCDDIIVIKDGSINIKSEISKGIKAMGNIFINGGDINIDTKDEGIETKATLTVNSGDINVKSDDDAINAGGGSGARTMNNVQDGNEHQIVINGGNITVDSKGDGIDSNGNLYFYGGNVLVNGPTSGGDGSLDTGSSSVYYGGTLLAAGSAGMVECPKAAEGKSIFNITLDSLQNAGSSVLIMDSGNKTIYEAIISKEFQNIIFASDDIKAGEEYSIYINGEKTVTLTAENSVTKYGGEQGGFGMRGMKNYNN